MGPALLQESQNALEYGEGMVRKWLSVRMLKDEKDSRRKARRIARCFNDANTHKSHGRRIDRVHSQKVALN
jgi:hypothetical protein